MTAVESEHILSCVNAEVNRTGQLDLHYYNILIRHRVFRLPTAFSIGKKRIVWLDRGTLYEWGAITIILLIDSIILQLVIYFLAISCITCRQTLPGFSLERRSFLKN